MKKTLLVALIALGSFTARAQRDCVGPEENRYVRTIVEDIQHGKSWQPVIDRLSRTYRIKVVALAQSESGFDKQTIVIELYKKR